MGYFAPPTRENWRMVAARSHERGIRIDWMAPEALATTWRVLATSVIWARTRSDAPDLAEAMEAGLLPPWQDGDWTIDARFTVSGNAFFLCRGTDSHAYPDFTAVLRMRVDDDLLVGLACRVRPPCSREDAQALLTWMGTDIEEWTEEPVPAVTDPTRSADEQGRIGPLLQALDQAEAAGDHERAAAIVTELRPDLVRAPLSRFALGIHVTEGWIEKRRAFSGDSQATSRAIDLLRRVIDSIDPAADVDLACAAAQWLAESYARRDEPGDLGRAALAYQTLLRLDRTKQPRRAMIHLRIGTLYREIADRAKNVASDRAREVRRLAMEQFDEAERIHRDAGEVAGRVEIAVAKADLVRLVPLPDDGDAAVGLYTSAWNLILGGEGVPRFAEGRFEELARHICRCMTAADHQRFGALPDDESGEVSGLGVFLRPLGITRVLAVRPPSAAGNDDPVTLEIALARALRPAIAFTYIGGPMHPGAASMITTASRSADWRIPVKMLLRERDVILLVPGETPGMQWELRFLVDEALLARTVLVMLPADVDPQSAGRWAGARTDASSFGLGLPAFRERGGFFRLREDGTVLKDLPFASLWEPGVLLDAVADLLSTRQALRERAGPPPPAASV